MFLLYISVVLLTALGVIRAIIETYDTLERLTVPLLVVGRDLVRRCQALVEGNRDVREVVGVGMEMGGVKNKKGSGFCRDLVNDVIVEDDGDDNVMTVAGDNRGFINDGSSTLAVEDKDGDNNDDGVGDVRNAEPAESVADAGISAATLVINCGSGIDDDDNENDDADDEKEGEGQEKKKEEACGEYYANYDKDDLTYLDGSHGNSFVTAKASVVIDSNAGRGALAELCDVIDCYGEKIPLPEKAHEAAGVEEVFIDDSKGDNAANDKTILDIKDTTTGVVGAAAILDETTPMKEPSSSLLTSPSTPRKRSGEVDERKMNRLEGVLNGDCDDFVDVDADAEDDANNDVDDDDDAAADDDGFTEKKLDNDRDNEDSAKSHNTCYEIEADHEDDGSGNGDMNDGVALVDEDDDDDYDVVAFGSDIDVDEYNDDDIDFEATKDYEKGIVTIIMDTSNGSGGVGGENNGCRGGDRCRRITRQFQMESGKDEFNDGVDVTLVPLKKEGKSIYDNGNDVDDHGDDADANDIMFDNLAEQIAKTLVWRESNDHSMENEFVMRLDMIEDAS